MHYNIKSGHFQLSQRAGVPNIEIEVPLYNCHYNDYLWQNYFYTMSYSTTAGGTTCEIKGQVYTECGSACPPTCTSPDSSDYCTKVCVKGCQCPSGTVLDTKTYQCVEPSKCGMLL